MRIRDPKLRNMAHALSLIVFIAFKGTNFYISIKTNINFRGIISSSEKYLFYCKYSICRRQMLKADIVMKK